MIHSYLGKTFSKVETAEITILVEKQCILRMNCGWQGDFNSILSSFIYREDNSDNWKIKNVAATGKGKNFMECEPLMRANLKFFIDEVLLLEAASWNAKTG